MTIVFQPVQEDESSLFGKFQLGRNVCMEYLQTQIDSYSIIADSNLLEWIKNSKSNDVLPDIYQERGQILADKFWNEEDYCLVFCQKCQQKITPKYLKKEEWDESMDVQGILVGSSGYRLVCPQNHVLLSVCTRLF